MANPVIDTYGEYVTRKTNPSGGFNPDTGEWEVGAEVSEDIFATIVPLNAAALLNEISEAGIESKDAIAIYSDVQLLEDDEDTQQPADRIVWKGHEYVIKSVSERYQIESLRHFKSIAFLKDS